ncbi:hypothetical protein O7623_00030 [Solwaraspora sp. WMMD791]|uniref:hypothetical protein n=1 Tax=Solwaraspora sp. WMMD791 TaxID=3016086 RepID=UPI00249AB6D5|nr:hypothetical protein [Solwaraspora sp. WMMD791]WFE27637.1 hypothetical protein O7623_31265 [Solwaraspora sp. WMMD791]WFE27650.1 hypothetical protein O7623_00030 [Solwaraspora sp. WMMD791]
MNTTSRHRPLAYTHAKSIRHPRPVCGLDNGPLTRVTEDHHLVTCPDCQELADIDALPDDATAGDPRVIEVLREAMRGATRKIDGVVVDPTTAAAILTVYDAAKPATRAKLAALPLHRMAQVAWRVLRPRV